MHGDLAVISRDTHQISLMDVLTAVILVNPCLIHLEIVITFLKTPHINIHVNRAMMVFLIVELHLAQRYLKMNCLFHYVPCAIHEPLRFLKTSPKEVKKIEIWGLRGLIG